MNAVALQKCLNHPAREAAARCTQCHEPYCRECVSEHDGRLVCANCLRALTKVAAAKLGWLKRTLSVGQLLIAVLFLWICFFVVGQMLLAIPVSFHEGDIWQKVGQQP